ncbi:Hypothetical protein FKW44_002438, partial [Caligus rogercresseyi]
YISQKLASADFISKYDIKTILISTAARYSALSIRSLMSIVPLDVYRRLSQILSVLLKAIFNFLKN